MNVAKASVELSGQEVGATPGVRPLLADEQRQGSIVSLSHKLTLITAMRSATTTY